jgi:regulator of sigma E protease
MLSQPPIWLILIAFVLTIGPLVFVHELGHYLVARWFGVGAEVFSIGFGREITGWTDKRGTRWKVGWLPLGGYVRFVGDEHAASQPASPDSVAPEDRHRSFHLKPVWQRFLIVLAGPVSNFLVAIAIFAALFAIYGVPRSPPIASAVAAGSAADRAGIEAGDVILSAGGRRIDSFETLSRYVSMRPGETVDITLNRSSERLTVPVRFDTEEEQDRFGNRFRVGRLGVYGKEQVLEPVSALQLIPTATMFTLTTTRSMIEGVWQIITGRRSVKELGGPLKIAQVAGQQASLGMLQFIQLVALISINLGFINLLPVPMLDGGHLLFYSIEAVQRRPVSLRAQEWAFRGGLALILALFVFTTVNDLGSFGLWKGLERLIG